MRAANDGKAYVCFSLGTADEKEAQRKINSEHEKVISRLEAAQRSQADGALAKIDRAVDEYFALAERQFGSMDEFCRTAMMMMFFVEAATSANEAQAPLLSQALGFDIDPLTMGVDRPVDLAVALTRHRVFEQQEPTKGWTLRETALRLLSKRWWAPAAFFVDAIVPISGHQWPVGSPGYERAAELFLQRLADHRFERWPSNLESALSAAPPALSKAALPVLAAPMVMAGASPRQSDKRLSELCDQWAKRVKPKPKSLAEAQRALRRFNQLYGDPFISHIDKQMMLDFRDLLLSLSARPRLEIRQLPPREQVAAADAHNLPRLSATSVEKEFGAIRAMLGFAAGENMLPQNVAAGIRISYEKDFGDKRLAFSEAELATIFSDEPLVSSTDHFEELYWFNVLGPLTGLRIEEMAAPPTHKYSAGTVDLVRCDRARPATHASRAGPGRP